MSTPQAVAQHALEQAQTHALITPNPARKSREPEDLTVLRILVSALNYIASNGQLSKQWSDLDAVKAMEGK